MSNSRPANRLAASSSPYLLQHAHNPVDWYPWGDEAITAARQRDVPIFLSVGYSTCYWCHVMERESFEDGAIARLLAERFVSIKLDREERPDLDELYMAATQMLTGHGGWPMNVFLDPHSLRPFWAGTYFPPTPARGMPSFTQVLERISTAWSVSREDIVSQAKAVADAVAQRFTTVASPVRLGPAQVSMAVQTLLTIFDRTDGGFGRAPKFPQPVYLELLLHVRSRIDAPSAGAVDAALRSTLDAMALGGMFDQVGGGFHRYSTDSTWTVPHFEKMLYDNAQLLGVYAQAAVDLGDPFYARIAERTVAYIAREMTAPNGMFLSAQDAEVDGREGLNYLWDAQAIRAALSADDAAFALAVYGIDRGPNFQDPHHPDAPAASVPRLDARPSPGDHERLAAINAQLLHARSHRPQPRLDDKIIRSWNAMTIASLARAARLLNQPSWLQMALRAAGPGFGSLFAQHFDSRTARETTSGTTHSGQLLLEDCAAEAIAHCELARADKTTNSREHVEAAVSAVQVARALFADHHAPGALTDARPSPLLFVQPRATYDGAVPTGSSLFLHALLDLHELTGQQTWLDQAAAILVSLSPRVHESPLATANATRGLLRLLHISPRTLEATQSAAAVQAATPPADVPVEVFASSSRVTVTESVPGQLYVRLVIPPGWHMNDAFAGDASGGTVHPLVVGVTAGKGVQPYAEYPRGTRFDGLPHAVLTGTVEFEVVLEQTGPLTGTPRLALTYQLCSDTACLAPVTVELDVVIECGGDSEIVTPTSG